MTRVQILLEQKEVQALKREAEQSGKSYSFLVREAIDNLYVSRFTEKEMAALALSAKLGKGTRKFRKLEEARRHLWSL
ncbi:MAG: ribbon-helix-helix protein, CopG family [Elusimicrobia bacterium]|nr:ribbon-helix-helix protein, CopG family [Elusimicrobiota bacterium]MBP9698815.1 ribbon-helix-helix protein, CopG family [Elusimicrobiota bacterium]